jgi:hypothetical protein
VFACSIEHGLAFPHVAADGLLAIYIGPGFHGRDGVQRVPMIGGTYQHNIQVFLLKHLTVVPARARRFGAFLPLASNLDRFGQHLFVGIADGYDLNRSHLDQSPEIALAVPTGPNQSHPSPFFGGKGDRGISGSGQGNNSRGAVTQELTAIHILPFKPTADERQSGMSTPQMANGENIPNCFQVDYIRLTHMQQPLESR